VKCRRKALEHGRKRNVVYPGAGVPSTASCDNTIPRSFNVNPDRGTPLKQQHHLRIRENLPSASSGISKLIYRIKADVDKPHLLLATSLTGSSQV